MIFISSNIPGKTGRPSRKIKGEPILRRTMIPRLPMSVFFLYKII